jgi:hypothetical protein
MAGFGGGAKDFVLTSPGQVIKANKFYNNRRYITCPSI